MINLGTRKVMRQGGSYVISLPKFWIDSRGIVVEKVNIQMENDNSLVIK